MQTRFQMREAKTFVTTLTQDAFPSGSGRNQKGTQSLNARVVWDRGSLPDRELHTSPSIKQFCACAFSLVDMKADLSKQISHFCSQAKLEGGWLSVLAGRFLFSA